jgi:hypothetical protein
VKLQSLKAIRAILLVYSAAGLIGMGLFWSSERNWNLCAGLFLACACWALLVQLFYIQPKGKT